MSVGLLHRTGPDQEASSDPVPAAGRTPPGLTICPPEAGSARTRVQTRYRWAALKLKAWFTLTHGRGSEPDPDVLQNQPESSAGFWAGSDIKLDPVLLFWNWISSNHSNTDKCSTDQVSLVLVLVLVGSRFVLNSRL